MSLSAPPCRAGWPRDSVRTESGARTRLDNAVDGSDFRRLQCRLHSIAVHGVSQAICVLSWAPPRAYSLGFDAALVVLPMMDRNRSRRGRAGSRTWPVPLACFGDWRPAHFASRGRLRRLDVPTAGQHPARLCISSTAAPRGATCAVFSWQAVPSGFSAATSLAHELDGDLDHGSATVRRVELPMFGH
jgi:hypothetical protein